METKQYLAYWAEQYKADLTENILPFWFQHGLDREHGGIFTAVDRDGTLMDSDKSMWFQGRFAFVCAFAYNHIERNPQWLEAARTTIAFIEKYGTDSDGHMFFEVTASGVPVRKRRYVFSECFAAIAMSEYALASGERQYGEKALTLFRHILEMTSTPGFLEPKFREGFVGKGHSLTMILINTASRIREAVGEAPILREQIDRSIAEIRRDFMHPEFKALLETVGPNGEFLDSMAGRIINPGHCIETAWFLLEEAKYRQWDSELTRMALTILDWSWEWGWDKEYGGIINFRDCKGFPCQDYSQDMKFWWPQTEAIIATLYAYLATHEERYLKMHRAINEYTYGHFPDPQYGEWFGYLHRDGTVAQPAKGNMFKGPFHIPRMMIKSNQLCHEILATLP